uniref:Uncharacterized protein n=1 Tax=Arundo donax TaxID=35708 RepID=A0A0A9HL27_ARUDO
MEDQNIHNAAHILNFSVGAFSIKYLGVSLHFAKLRREDLQHVVDKIVKRVAGWRGRLLGSAIRLTLVKKCLASIPIYLLSFIKFPKWAIEAINSQMAHCVWTIMRIIIPII